MLALMKVIGHAAEMNIPGGVAFDFFPLCISHACVCNYGLRSPTFGVRVMIKCCLDWHFKFAASQMWNYDFISAVEHWLGGNLLSRDYLKVLTKP